MKKNVSYFIILLLCLVSCQKDFEFEEFPISRAIVDENRSSISNPDLIYNWENIDRITINTIGADLTSKKVTPPWSDGTSSPLSEIFRKDIKKEDGWKMLFHTFKEVGLDEKQNYICFYNQFTGVIKVFYYYEGENQNQGTQWFIRTSNNQNAKLFNLVEYVTPTDTAAYDHNMLLFSNFSGDPIGGISPGWNGFEFEVPYCTDYKNIDFVIGAYDKRIINFDFSGKTESSITGTITSTKQKKPGIINKALASLAGPEAKKLVDKLPEKVNLGSKLTDLVKSIPSKGYVSAISSGLNSIFSKTTTTTQDVKLTTSGSITMEGTGTSEATAGIPSLSFSLYNTLNPTQEQVSTSSSFVYNMQTATNEHYVGLWTMRTVPLVIYERVTSVSEITRFPSYGTDYYGVTGKTNTPKLWGYSSITINPDVAPYITGYTIDHNFIVCDTLEGAPFKKGIVDVADLGKKTLLYSDGNNCFYEALHYRQEIPNGSWPVYIYHDPSSYYYDWGFVTNGRLLVVLSINIEFSYLGKTTVVNQSRTYNVGYGTDALYEDLPDDLHHPPFSYVLNYGYPYFQERNFWRD